MAGRILYACAGIIFFLGLAIFYFLAPEDNAPALLAPEAGRRRLTILDSAFWSADQALEPDFARLTDETNPLTGEPYTADQVERIRTLWRLYPENSLLPQPARNRFRLEKETERFQEIARDLAAGEADLRDVEELFERRRREIQDRIQLVEHVLTESWPGDVMERYRAMLDRDRRLLEEVREERAVALEILKNKKIE